MISKITNTAHYMALSMRLISNYSKSKMVLWIIALTLSPTVNILSTLVNRNMINGLELLFGGGEFIIVIKWFAVLIAMKAGENLFYKLQTRSFYRMALSADESMMLYTMDKTASLQQIFFDSSEKYDKLKDIINNDFSLWSLNGNLLDILTNFITILGVCVILLPYNALLTGVVSLMAIPLFIFGIIGRKYDETSAAAQRRSGYATGYYSELLNSPTAAKETRLFGTCSLILECWIQSRCRHRKIIYKINRRKNILAIAIVIFEVLCAGLTMYICANDVVAGTATIGDFFLYTANFAVLFTAISDIMLAIRSALHISSEYNEYLNFSTSLAGQREGCVDIPEEQITIRFENVSLKYDEKPVLKNVSFEWREGETIALIGRNGSGKSTLIKLLCGLYECESGAIYINGINVKEYSQTILYKLFGTIYQDFCHYQLTLREILAAQNMAQVKNNEALWRAFDMAECGEFRNLFTAGLDTSLGREYEQDGVEFSGGQWQKIAIVRNYFGSRRFQIFDEPASSLDPQSEHKLIHRMLVPDTLTTCSVNAFIEKKGGNSYLVISHRLSVGRMANCVLFLEDGRIIEQGTHDELISEGGAYSKMYRSQASKYIN